MGCKLPTELILFLTFCSFLPFELVPDWHLTPDDEEVCEQVEDSLMEMDGLMRQTRMRSQLLLRLGADSVPRAIAEPRSFIRLKMARKNQEGCVIVEKDAGEINIADFFGGGFSFKKGGWRFTFGDHLLHFGRGLIFSSPYARSGFSESGLGQSDNVFARSAQENRNLRGFRIDRAYRRFSFSVSGSYSLRDAALNSDGTVSRLKYSGLHRDSVSVQEKGQAAQMLAGVIAQMRLNEHLSTGLAVQGIRFNRAFAPEESVYSFSGQNLSAFSLFLKADASGRSGELEIANSGLGAIAASARVAVKEAGVSAAIAGMVYSARFFSPAGRSYGLVRKLSRAEVNANIDYSISGFFACVNGNTRRDYPNDSIPARVQFSAGYKTEPVQVRLVLGKRFCLEDEQSRNSRIEIDARGRVVALRLILGDEYLEGSSAQGRIAGLNIRIAIKSVDISLGGALVDINGKGVRVNVPEPGLMRLGTSFSSDESAQRLSITSAVTMKGLGRLGAKIGLTHTDGWQPDFGMQAEVMN